MIYCLNLFFLAGYEVLGNEWDEHGGFIGMDGSEIPYTVSSTGFASFFLNNALSYTCHLYLCLFKLYYYQNAVSHWNYVCLQGMQAENGSLIYYMPGYGYPQPAYNPYNTYFPGAMLGADGVLAHQPYYPSPIYQQPLTSPAYFQPPVAYGSEVPPAFSWDSLAVADRANGNTFNGSAAAGPRTNQSTAAVS